MIYIIDNGESCSAHEVKSSSSPTSLPTWSPILADAKGESLEAHAAEMTWHVEGPQKLGDWLNPWSLAQYGYGDKAPHVGDRHKKVWEALTPEALREAMSAWNPAEVELTSVVRAEAIRRGWL